MLQRLLICACPALLSTLAPFGAAQVHPELLVGCDAAQKLVVKFDAEQLYALPASRFDGIDGYADAMPGFMSLFAVRPGDDWFPADPSANLVFVLVEADVGIAVLNDHGTAVMRAGETFTLGHPPFDAHPVWQIASGAARKPYQLKMQLRDTTGRYQPSDVFAPSFVPDDATAVYVCPMRCDLGKTYTTTGLCPVCDMRLKLYSGRNYRVRVTPDPKLSADGRVRAGVPTPLAFEISSPDGTRADDLEIVHEKLVHLLMVSEDLSWFAHEHPELQSDGTFKLTFAFPRGGRYVLYNDFTPKRAGMQVVPVELEVVGEKAAPVPLKPSADRTTSVDGYTVKLTTPSPLTSLRSQDLRVNISRDGKPVSDLEPFLGALGHIIVVSENRKHFVHSHPLEPARTGAETATRRGGPDVVFSAQFPAAGIYKAWAQFQHKGHVITAPFVIDVVSMLAPPPVTAPAPAESPKPQANADMDAAIKELMAKPEQADEQIEVQHILIAFEGALPGVTRGKGEAKALAQKVYAEAMSGGDFDALVRQHTNDSAPGIYPITKAGRARMVKGFGDVGFRLKVGEIGVLPWDATASPYGWHIIKRLK